MSNGRLRGTFAFNFSYRVLAVLCYYFLLLLEIARKTQTYSILERTLDGTYRPRKQKPKLRTDGKQKREKATKTLPQVRTSINRSVLIDLLLGLGHGWPTKLAPKRMDRRFAFFFSRSRSLSLRGWSWKVTLTNVVWWLGCVRLSPL